VSNVVNMSSMFPDWRSNDDISQLFDMFYGSPLEKNPPKWYKK